MVYCVRCIFCFVKLTDPVLQRRVHLEGPRPLLVLLRGDGHGLRRARDLLHLPSNVHISDQLVGQHLLAAAWTAAVLNRVRPGEAVNDAVAAEGGAAAGRQRRLAEHLVAERAPQGLLHLLGPLGEGGHDLLLDGIPDAQLLVLIACLVRDDVMAAVPRKRESHTAGAKLLALLDTSNLPEEATGNALRSPHLLHVVWVLVCGALPNPVALRLASHLTASMAGVVGRWRLGGFEQGILFVGIVVALPLALAVAEGQPVGTRVAQAHAGSDGGHDAHAARVVLLDDAIYCQVLLQRLCCQGRCPRSIQLE